MKKLLLLGLFLILGANIIQAQLRLNTYAIGTFSDNVESYYSSSNYFKGRVDGGFMWGGGLEYMLHKYNGIECFYQRMDTHAPMTYIGGNFGSVKFTNFNLGLNNIMLAFNRYFPTGNNKVEPFAGVFLGLSIFDLKNPDDNSSSSITKLGYGFRAGVNLWASKKIAVKILAQMASASQAVGGGFYFGTGGSGVGLSSYSSFLQFGLGAGLTFKLGDDTPTPEKATIYRRY